MEAMRAEGWGGGGGGPLKEGGRQLQVEVTGELGVWRELKIFQKLRSHWSSESEGLSALILYAGERELGFIPRAWEALEGFYRVCVRVCD